MDLPFLPDAVLQPVTYSVMGSRWSKSWLSGKDLHKKRVRVEVAEMKAQSPDFSLEVKAVSLTGAIDSAAPRCGMKVYALGCKFRVSEV